MWPRVLAIVVQPGVEFSHEGIAVYWPDRAAVLADALRRMPCVVFEAHFTDYRPEAALRRLVADGFPILKVGPGLPVARRKALYGPDAIEAVLNPDAPHLATTLEALMRAQPEHWRSHYPGMATGRRVLCHRSDSAASAAIGRHPKPARRSRGC